MDRRIYGLETEYGISCRATGARRLSPDEVARYLFRTVVSWGRSSNVFLANGSRIYLDVGSHPEYATAECDDLASLIAHDKAGEQILIDLARDAENRLAGEGVKADIYLFKNNTDSHGNSYGCHENYLIGRAGDFSRWSSMLIPFLVSRQLICGAGKIVTDGRRASYALSQRADHMWEAVSSATTRSRPMINTRDEPHADPERFRRLHVIVGDSNMSEATTMLKVGSTELVLRLIEDQVAMRDLTLENPIRAIRDISRDRKGAAVVRLANGQTMTGLELQREYLNAAVEHAGREGHSDPHLEYVVELWRRTLDACETDRPELIDTEVDWAIKLRLLNRFADRHNLSLGDPRLAQVDLAYHDIAPDRGLYQLAARRGAVETVVEESDVAFARKNPPPRTRAQLRGRFIQAARDAGVDYTVDWVHLKLNDQSQRTVLCKDPFVYSDERVDRLIESIGEHP